METTVYVFSILMWFVCPAIIGLVLLQGAAGDISSAFGGGGMLDSTLGVGAHKKMAKFTGLLAGVFFIMVLILAYPGKSSLRDVKLKPLAAPTAPVAVPSASPTTEQPSTSATNAVTVPAPSATTAEVTPPPSTTPVIVTDAPATPTKSEESVPPLLKLPQPVVPPATVSHPETSQQPASTDPATPPVNSTPK